MKPHREAVALLHGPLDLDSPFGVAGEAEHVGTVLPVDGDAAAARKIGNHLLAGNRPAALRIASHERLRKSRIWSGAKFPIAGGSAAEKNFAKAAFLLSGLWRVAQGKNTREM